MDASAKTSLQDKAYHLPVSSPPAHPLPPSLYPWRPASCPGSSVYLAIPLSQQGDAYSPSRPTSPLPPQPRSRNPSLPLSTSEIPLTSPSTGDDAYTIIFKLSNDGTWVSDFNRAILLKWVNGERILVIVDAESTIFVWDRELNRKWRFQRPKGQQMDEMVADVAYTRAKDSEGTILSLDGSGKVRFWELSTA